MKAQIEIFGSARSRPSAWFCPCRLDGASAARIHLYQGFARGPAMLLGGLLVFALAALP
ncbi:MAG: hypothetical protein QOH97_1227 [Actinoplanes sp.]|nr:hypothetical protein [Actinoplanes sp.]